MAGMSAWLMHKERLWDVDIWNSWPQEQTGGGGEIQYSFRVFHVLIFFLFSFNTQQNNLSNRIMLVIVDKYVLNNESIVSGLTEIRTYGNTEKIWKLIIGNKSSRCNTLKILETIYACEPF